MESNYEFVFAVLTLAVSRRRMSEMFCCEDSSGMRFEVFLQLYCLGLGVNRNGSGNLPRTEFRGMRDGSGIMDCQSLRWLK